MILILVAFGAMSVVMLGYMAERYRKLLEPEEVAAVAVSVPEPAPVPIAVADPDPRVRVEGYLAVREAVARAAEALVPPRAQTIEDSVGYSLSNVRDVYLMRHGLTPRDYVELRALELRWLAGDPALDSRVRQAYERRRERLLAATVAAYDDWER